METRLILSYTHFSLNNNSRRGRLSLDGKSRKTYDILDSMKGIYPKCNFMMAQEGKFNPGIRLTTLTGGNSSHDPSHIIVQGVKAAEGKYEYEVSIEMDDKLVVEKKFESSQPLKLDALQLVLAAVCGTESIKKLTPAEADVHYPFRMVYHDGVVRYVELDDIGYLYKRGGLDDDIKEYAQSTVYDSIRMEEGIVYNIEFLSSKYSRYIKFLLSSNQIDRSTKRAIQTVELITRMISTLLATEDDPEKKTQAHIIFELNRGLESLQQERESAKSTEEVTNSYKKSLLFLHEQLKEVYWVKETQQLLKQLVKEGAIMEIRLGKDLVARFLDTKVLEARKSRELSQVSSVEINCYRNRTHSKSYTPENDSQIYEQMCKIIHSISNCMIIPGKLSKKTHLFSFKRFSFVQDYSAIGMYDICVHGSCLHIKTRNEPDYKIFKIVGFTSVVKPIVIASYKNVVLMARSTSVSKSNLMTIDIGKIYQDEGAPNNTIQIPEENMLEINGFLSVFSDSIQDIVHLIIKGKDSLVLMIFSILNIKQHTINCDLKLFEMIQNREDIDQYLKMKQASSQSIRAFRSNSTHSCILFDFKDICIFPHSQQGEFQSYTFEFSTKSQPKDPQNSNISITSLKMHDIIYIVRYRQDYFDYDVITVRRGKVVKAAGNSSTLSKLRSLIRNRQKYTITADEEHKSLYAWVLKKTEFKGYQVIQMQLKI